jgi:hypothetical protein
MRNTVATSAAVRRGMPPMLAPIIATHKIDVRAACRRGGRACVKRVSGDRSASGEKRERAKRVSVASKKREKSEQRE